MENPTEKIDISGELQRALEDKISYFEAGCIVYRHSASLIDRTDTLIEIDKTLDEANAIRRQLGQLAL